MKKKIIKALVVVVVSSFAACGRVDLPAEAEPAVASAQVQAPPDVPSEPGRPERLGPAPVRSVSTTPAIAVGGVGVFPAGVKVRAITGLMSCGFGETGHADSVTADGSFRVSVPQKQSYGMNAVLVWVDVDGDGVCGTTDLTAEFTFYGGGVFTALDLTNAREAGCYWFQ